MNNGYTIHISQHAYECFMYFGLGIAYGLLIAIAVDTFKNRRKAK